ncbi:MAG: type II/IV secretion system protein, partial [Comamonas sp.]
MTTSSHLSASPVLRPRHVGQLDWRSLVQWLLEDGLVTAQEAERVTMRCSSAESAQHPLVRLANVGVVHAGTGKTLDIEELTQYLGKRSGLAYLRIDPLRVDVGRVGDVMSASYAERHKVLPVQVSGSEVVIATAEPFQD